MLYEVITVGLEQPHLETGETVQVAGEVVDHEADRLGGVDALGHGQHPLGGHAEVLRVV